MICWTRTALFAQACKHAALTVPLAVETVRIPRFSLLLSPF
jgi:hypothetical protein